MGIVHPKPYNLKWPLTSTQVEGMDEMFLTLFKATRALQETVVAPVTSTLTSSTSVLGNIGSVIGQIGVRPSKQADEDSSSSSWPVTGINTPPSALFTQGSVIFAGPSGVLAQDNTNFFWDAINHRLGIGTATPSSSVEIHGVLWQYGYSYLGAVNSQVRPAVPSSIPGLAINWNYTGSAGEFDIWNSYPGAGTSFIFKQLTGASSHTDLMTLLANGNVGIGTIAPLHKLTLGVGTQNIAFEGAGGVPYAGFGYDFGLDGGNGAFVLKTNNGAADFNTIPMVLLRVSGNIGIGLVAPTAALHLKAGTVNPSTAPMKFTSGVNLTTAEAGAIEFTTDDFVATITTGAARKAFILDNGSRLTSGKVPIATTNGRLIDSTASLLIAAGFASVVASTFEKTETGSDANVLTYTTGAADEALNIQVMTDVSAITGTSIVVTVTWKDSNNVTATSILTLTAVGDGTINVPINAFTATNVVISTVFVGVSTAYKISAVIVRLK